MTHWEIILLSIALAMDCFTVSIAAGITARRVVRWPMTVMALSFGLFQGGMTLLGYVGMDQFRDQLESIDHWIAFSLLLYLGTRMILESRKEEEEKTLDLLSLRTIPTMAVATSIDALAVGISMSCSVDTESLSVWRALWYPVLMIGLGSLLFTILGLGIGIKVGRHINWPVEAVGGVVLIGIGVKILIEHLA